MPAVGPTLRRLFETFPAAGRGSPVLCLLLLMVAAVAYWSPLPSPGNETTNTTAVGIGSSAQSRPATEPPLLLKVGDTGQKIGLAQPHFATSDEARDCREHGRGFFCDVVTEPTVDLRPGALVKVIDRLELWQRVTGGFGQVTWYQVQAVKPDGTNLLGADGKIIAGWAQSNAFSTISR
jgi:hypothetical protein